jgi:hypothetical protein
MKTVTVELLSDATNQAVLRIPGRKFPGILLQGDSVASLYDMAKEIGELWKSGDKNDIPVLAQQLEAVLGEKLKHYEAVLRENKIELPYSPSIT